MFFNRHRRSRVIRLFLCWLLCLSSVAGATPGAGDGAVNWTPACSEKSKGKFVMKDGRRFWGCILAQRGDVLVVRTPAGEKMNLRMDAIREIMFP